MKSFLSLAVVAAIFFSCSTPQEPAPVENQAVRIHDAAWNTPGSPQFHGTVLAGKNYDSADCRQCHGNDYDGGLVQISCRSCHASYPHPQTWAGQGQGSHAVFLQTEGYPLGSCTGCHGADYSAEKQNTSCLSCHVQEKGPEACNTCHGQFDADASDLRNAAPPAGIAGERDTETRAVGAHQAHLALVDSTSAASMCSECHDVPATLNSPGHIDGDGRAEVVFDGWLATTASADGQLMPQGEYDDQTGSCSNTYCHGNWQLNKATATLSFIYAADSIAGANATPVWTDPASAACGTCHALPPAGHNPAETTACVTCHAATVDAAGEIIDTQKHVNGKINALAQENAMR